MTTEHPDEIYEQHHYNDSSHIPFSHIEFLGRGSFGTVDKVRRTSGPFQGQIYARKVIVMPADELGREAFQTALRNEIDIVKRLQHPHVVRVTGAYTYRRQFAILMTPAAEEDLYNFLYRVDASALDSTGPAEREKIGTWFGCIASAMEFIHGRHIGHLDIKPSNFLISNGNILLTDFGIARDLPAETIDTTTVNPGPRTPMYCAPEAADGHRRGRLADMFSLGAVFLEMLTVYSGHKQLEKFNQLRQSSDGRSYANHLKNVIQWIDILDSSRFDVSWYSSMLYLCRRMLQSERHLRPTSEDIRQCWSYQPFSALPPTTCSCMSHLDPKRDMRDINSALRVASGNGHRLAIYLMATRGAAVNGSGALEEASLKGQKDTVGVLLDLGADVGAKGGKGGKTALHEAARNGHEAVVRLLLDKGTDLEVKDSTYNQTPLSWAAERGHEAVVRLLLDKGAELETKDSTYGRTPLSWVAEKGHEAVARLLLDKGVDVETRSKSDLTPLSWAAKNGREAVAQLLLDKGVNLEAKDPYDQTPLSLAAENGHEAVVRLLLDKGANIEARDSFGQTPLSWAAENGHEVVVRLLLDKGAELETKDSMDGLTPLLWATEKGNEAVVRRLLDKGANLEARGTSNQTPLSLAAENGNEAIVRLLLNKGANLEARSTSGQTPLSLAAENGNKAIVRLLLPGRVIDPEIAGEFGRMPLS
ncbi:MAG: hypothetical protein M1813_007253 [Trichoglossum hirsutum]|nr:MAG: hypothetical protein M1813_007253 [Trichoglossum hirsutum]